MYIGMCRHLYAIFLVCVSSSSVASLTVTKMEVDHGGFAFPVICSHSDLHFCVKAEHGPEPACVLYQSILDARYSFSFQGIQTLSNGVQRCSWKGKNPEDNTDVHRSATLIFKNGLCPKKDDSPPDLINFARNGRWFPQELGTFRCYRSCEYTNGQSFNFKHLSYTNGIVTQFDEISSSRLRSNQKFCIAEVEPSKSSDDEITYASDCEDAVFKTICDFVNWYRNDADMPDPPEVKKTELELTNHLDTSRIQIQSDADNLCFAPVQFNMFLPFSRTEIKQEFSFDQFCAKINEFGNLWRAFYILMALYIIFGGRK